MRARILVLLISGLGALPVSTAALAVSPPDIHLELRPGQTQGFLLAVTSPVGNQTVLLATRGFPEAWGFEAEPRVVTLRRNESALVQAWVHLPLDATAGSYVFTVQMLERKHGQVRGEMLVRLDVEGPPIVASGTLRAIPHEPAVGPGPTKGAPPTWIALSMAASVSLLFLLEPFRLRVVLLGLLVRPRHRRELILDQATRRRIVDMIHATPGVHFSRLARLLGLGTGALAYHVHLLERSGLIQSLDDGFRRRFFGEGAPLPPPRSLLEGVAESIAHYVAEHPGAEQEEVAHRLGIGTRVTSYHVRRLVRGRHIVSHPAGRTNRLYPAP